MERPGSRLFREITEAQYQAAYNTLLMLRAMHPTYSDADLLMFALASTVREEL